MISYTAIAKNCLSCPTHLLTLYSLTQSGSSHAWHSSLSHLWDLNGREQSVQTVIGTPGIECVCRVHIRQPPGNACISASSIPEGQLNYIGGGRKGGREGLTDIMNQQMDKAMWICVLLIPVQMHAYKIHSSPHIVHTGKVMCAGTTTCIPSIL